MKLAAVLLVIVNATVLLVIVENPSVVVDMQLGAPLHNLALYRSILPISKPGTMRANSKSRARINPNGLKFQYHWNSTGSPFGEPGYDEDNPSPDE